MPDASIFMAASVARPRPSLLTSIQEPGMSDTYNIDYYNRYQI